MERATRGTRTALPSPLAAPKSPQREEPRVAQILYARQRLDRRRA
nr:MAG TPA: hypothetical protein [Caudoviricetes sp.]